MSNKATAIALCALLAAAPGLAPAQDLPDDRRGEPAQIEERLSPPAAPPADVEVPLPAATPSQAADGAAERFVLAAVIVEGVTVYDADTLAAIYAPYLAREVSLADVQALVDAITERYQADGHVLSRAVVRPQELGFGVLRIEALEGFIERVVIEGEVAGSRALLERYAEKLKAERPLSLDRLERYLLLIEDLPGVTVRPGLRRLGELSPAHELVLRLTHDPFEGALSVDNRGTRPVGRYIGQVGLQLNSPLGLYGRSGLRFYSVPGEPRELLFVELRQTMPVGAEGTTVTLAGWRSEIEAGASLERFDVDSLEQRAALELAHPILRSRDLSLSLHAEFEVRNTEERFFGRDSFDDRLRSLRAGFRLYFRDRLDGQTLLTLQGSQGLETLNGSEARSAPLSRAGGRPDYVKLQGEAVRLQSLGDDWALRASVSAQRAGSRLLSAEEFRIGGASYGRGYDPAEIAGEHGVAAALELQRTVRPAGPVFDALQVYGFYDVGAAWDEARGNGITRRSLASAGLGLRVVAGRFRAGFELAKPLTRRVAGEGQDGDHTRAFGILSFRF